MSKMTHISANVDLGFQQKLSAVWRVVWDNQTPFLVYHDSLSEGKIGLVQMEPSRIQYPDNAPGVLPIYQGLVGPDDHSLTQRERVDFADQLSEP